MTLTTIDQGLADNCPRHIAELERKRWRLAAYRQRKFRHDLQQSVIKLGDFLFDTKLQTRSGTGRASSTADHSRSFIGRAFNHLGKMFCLSLWFAVLFASTYIIGALMEPVEPETRCFTNAIGETYCRDQFVWEVE